MSSTSVLLSALSWSLLHAVWQGAVLAAALAVARFVLRRSAPASRHLACCLALFALPVAWGLTFLWLLSAPTSSAFVVEVSSASLPAWAPWLLGGWLVGLTGSSARTLAGLWRLNRLSAWAEDVDAAWSLTFTRLSRQADVRRVVRLATSARIDVPMVLGWLRPVVLVPPCLLTGLPPDAVEAVLLHELLHVRRHDWLVSLAQSCVEAFFFHVPAAWWMSNCLREERELRCDSEAAAVHRDRLSYARALIELEQLRQAPVLDRLAPSARGGSFVTRIRLLVQPETAAPSAGGRGFAFALTPLVVALAAWSIVHLGVQAAGPSDRVERWRPMIEAAAEQHGVDAGLLTAMVQVESGGAPDVESSAGALGLMQVMPATAARIAAERGQPAPDADRLLDPDYNLDAAAWFLARQLENFSRSDAPEAGVDHAIAAYNAGAPRVRSWLEGRRELPLETQRYVESVRASWGGPSQLAATAPLSTPTMTVHPLPEGRRTSGFGRRQHPMTGATALHRGLDLAAPRGTPVLAVDDGEVLRAARNGKDGLVVVLRHDDGLETRYHHLHELSVSAGQRIEAGSAVGTVGSTGLSSGPHLHFELRRDGAPVDPEAYLPKAVEGI